MEQKTVNKIAFWVALIVAVLTPMLPLLPEKYRLPVTGLLSGLAGYFMKAPGTVDKSDLEKLAGKS